MAAKANHDGDNRTSYEIPSKLWMEEVEVTELEVANLEVNFRF